MADDEHDTNEQASGLRRRDVLAGTAATAATAALPGMASAAAITTSGGVNIFGAVYMDPRYLATFNNKAYAPGNIGAVHTMIKQKFSNRSDLQWGLYQRDVEKNPANWGSQAAYDNWPYFSQEARHDLEKQPATFSSPKNAMNPFDTTQVAANLMEHLDEVIRIALWDFAVPMKIKVGKKRRRHHGLTTEWDPVPNPGTNPHVQPNGLTINIDCPEGGWQGYTLWRNTSATDHITKFSATWKVPSAPANQEGQIIFIFNGLESLSGPGVTGAILQPVLQWTSAGWYMRSWYVLADFDAVAHPDLPDLSSRVDQSQPGGDNHRYYSKAVRVSTGDVITGSIVGGRDPTGKFNYTSSLSLGGTVQQDTVLTFNDVPEMVYAVCAIESYGVTLNPPRKPDYPAGTISMTGLDLRRQQPVSPIVWEESKKIGGDYSVTTPSGRVDFKPA